MLLARPQFPGFGASPADLLKWQTDIQRYLQSITPSQTMGLPPIPGFPGYNASDADLLKFQEAIQKYEQLVAQYQGASNPAPGPAQTTPAYPPGGDSLIDQLGKLPEKPPFPGENASDQDLLKYQEGMQKYNRAITMITSILQMESEAKKSVVQNLRA